MRTPREIRHNAMLLLGIFVAIASLVALGNAARAADQIATPGNGYASQVLADMPTVYWRLQETVGSVAASEVTSTAMDLDAAYENGFTAVDGPVDAAVLFGGSQQARASAPLAMTHAWNQSRSWSLEFWLKLTAAAIPQQLIYKGNGTSNAFEIELNGSGVLKFSSDNHAGACNPTSDVVSDITVNDTAWHHVAYTYDDATNSFAGYLDGTSIFSVTCDFNPTPSNFNVVVANASFAEVAFYQWPLPADRVDTHWRAQEPCLKSRQWRKTCKPKPGQVLTAVDGGNAQFLGPVIKSTVWPAAVWGVDGGSCTAPVEESMIGAGTAREFVTYCGSVNGSIYGSVRMPASFLGGAVRFRIIGNSKSPSPSGGMTAEFSCACRSENEAEATLFLTYPGFADITFDGAQYSNEMGESQAIECDGPCVGGDVLSWRGVMSPSVGVGTLIRLRHVIVETRHDARGGLQ